MYIWRREIEERVSPSRFIRAPPCCAVDRFISRLLERVPCRIMLCIIIRVLYYYVQKRSLLSCYIILYGKLYLSYVAYIYNEEIVSLIGNQRVGIFPPKSKILFYLSLALIWCQNFQDWTIPVGGDTWPSCTSETRNNKNKNNNKNKEITR